MADLFPDVRQSRPPTADSAVPQEELDGILAMLSPEDLRGYREELLFLGRAWLEHGTDGQWRWVPQKTMLANG
jgi:hypothetical protein